MSNAVRDVVGDPDFVGDEGRAHRYGWIVLVVLVVLVAWLIAAGVMLLSARQHLAAAERAFPATYDALTGGDLDAARAAVATLSDETAAASQDLGSLLVRPLRVAPYIGTDLRAASAIADAGRDVSGAVERLFDTLTQLPDGIASLGPRDGRFPVDELVALEPDLREVARAIAAADARVTATPDSGRFGAVTSARERVLDQLDPLVGASRSAAELARALPPFLGAEGPRTYLFGASTPAELRGTGGFIGSVSLLTVDDGRPEFGPFTATSDLPVLPPDELPPPVEEDAARWSRYAGTGAWHGLQRTPHFPAAATAMERLWMATEGTEVDGMIVADPYALQALLELSGPVEDPRFGRLDAGTVVSYVAHDAYGELTDPDERKQVLGAVAAATFEGFLERGTDRAATRGLVEELAALIADGHLILHSTDDSVQAALSAAGATGELGDPDGDLVNVVLNSGSASKVDYYAERRIQHRVTLLEGGASRNELTLTIANEAPTSGQPAYVIGPNNPTLDVGGSLTEVSVYAARGARFTTTPPAADGLPSTTGSELGRSVHDGWARLASGESQTRTYTWVTPDAWRITDDGYLRYELLFQGQTVIRPTAVDLRVHLPDGMTVTVLPDDTEIEGGAVVWTGEGRGRDIRLELLLERDLRTDASGS